MICYKKLKKRNLKSIFIYIGFFTIFSFTLTLIPLSYINAESSTGNTIYVDDSNLTGIEDGSIEHPFKTINAALKYSSSTTDSITDIYVAGGIYNENILLVDGISIIGGFDPEKEWSRNLSYVESIIIGKGDDTVIIFRDLKEGAVLSGFTIKNGNSRYGGGIRVENSANAIISENIITANTAVEGGGIYITLSNPEILNNLLFGNTAQLAGGGMASNKSSPTIINNTVCNNISSSGIGGGISSNKETFVCISNCIIWNNGDDLENVSAVFSDIEDSCEGTGNISLEPQFNNPATFDFTLKESSPCILPAKMGYLQEFNRNLIIENKENLVKTYLVEDFSSSESKNSSSENTNENNSSSENTDKNNSENNNIQLNIIPTNSGNNYSIGNTNIYSTSNVQSTQNIQNTQNQETSSGGDENLGYSLITTYEEFFKTCTNSN
jgi:hypothetical protein